MAMTLQARLARLEALESAQRFPTTLEFHRAVPVAADDHRRGSMVIEGNEVTFFASTAAEYRAASDAHFGDRALIRISIDERCLTFPREVAQ